jgi:aspartate aminotransferase
MFFYNKKVMANLSKLANNIIGSEIIKISKEVNSKIKNGETVYNLTIGDFNPKIFPIPGEFKRLISEQLDLDMTNYPESEGESLLRQSISKHLETRHNLDYGVNEMVVASGARPVIYSLFKTILDEGDKVIYPVPSWNNNHYTYLNHCQICEIETTPENRFLPQASDIAKWIGDCNLIALCSPQNPTGSMYTKSQLLEICDLVILENSKRIGRKPVYVMFDQIYSELVYSSSHWNPVNLRPEMKKWTISIDGISKSLSATGVRVGWAFGPEEVISKMKSILTHIGAWASKPEQLACANFLISENYNTFITEQREKLHSRLMELYGGLIRLKYSGLPIDVLKPEGALYLSVKIDLLGRYDFKTSSDIQKWILDKCGVALVPFSAFGCSPQVPWFRASVGNLELCLCDEITRVLETQLSKLLQCVD